MPPRQLKQARKAASEEVSDHSEASSPAIATRIIILPKSTLKSRMKSKTGDSASQSAAMSVSVIKLRNPKTGIAELFLLDGPCGKIYQLSHLKESPRSWFVNDTVCQDGSLILTTPMDVLFLVLPYLNQHKMYRPLEQILVDSELPDCNKLLLCEEELQQITSVADVKELKDQRVYRFSMEKCTAWLKRKVNSLQKVLQNRRVHVVTGAQAATFIRNKKENVASEEDYLRYAHGIISEYLPDEISIALLQHLEVSRSPPVDEQPVEPAIKRAKLKHDGPIEDYSACNMYGNETTKKNLTSAQKALNKVDKTGMKNISSFFSKKNTEK